MAIDLRLERINRQEARHIERDDELTGIGFAHLSLVESLTSRPNAARLSGPPRSPSTIARPLPCSRRAA